jgi:hypothetical protein
MCPVDAELGSIFVHPKLQTLTISCARIDGAELDHLQAFAQRTPLSSLSLDQCDMSFSGLTTILSLPASLKALRVLEVSHQGPRRYALEYSHILIRALSLQRTSLDSLCLSLREPKQSPFTQDFDMSAFHSLRLLKISCQPHGQSIYPTSLNWATYAPPALDTLVFSGIELQNRRDNVTLPADLQACLKTLDPTDLCDLAHTVCLSIQSGYDVPSDSRKAVEELGKRFRKASSQSSVTFSSRSTYYKGEGRGSPRLCVSRFRERGAIPPYLFHEYGPDELTIYDSSSRGSGWLNATDRSSGASVFEHRLEHFNLDFSGLEAADVLNDFHFDSFLNHEPDSNMGTVFEEPFLHDHAHTVPDWSSLEDPLDLDAIFGPDVATQSHYHVNDEEETDSVN